MSDSRRKVYDCVNDNYKLLCDNEDMELEAYTAYNHETGLVEMLYRTHIVNITNPQTIRNNYRARREQSNSKYPDHSGSVSGWVEPPKEFGLVDELQKETNEWLNDLNLEVA